MCRLFESIKLLDGLPQNLDYHYRRMRYAFQHFYGEGPRFELDIAQLCRQLSLKGCHKLKITYDVGQFSHEVVEYQLREVVRYRLVEDTDISYAFKFVDRDAIERWQQDLAENEDLILLKKGMVSDSAYANLLFKSPDGELFTPQDCLLKGTRRQKLIDERRIKTLPISMEDLYRFTHVCRINAMMDLGEDDWLPVDRITML
jgi:4-amino-4-deoxychorismate lyase